METASHRESTDRVLDIIRSRVDRRAGGQSELGLNLATLKTRFSMPTIEYDPARMQWSISELLADYDRQFLTRAYLALLKREPDAEGLRTRLQDLRSGRMSRVEVLFRLRYGGEGRVSGVRVKGLWAAFVVDYLCRIPVVGIVFRLARALCYLPRMQQDIEEVRGLIAMHRSESDERVSSLSDTVCSNLELQNHHIKELYRRQIQADSSSQ